MSDIQATTAPDRHRRRLVTTVGAATALALVALAAAGATAAARSPGTEFSRDAVVAFQEAGDVGGGALEPGTSFPPTNRGFATLKRGDDWIRSNIHTSGLPAGTYTVWWVIFNDPEHCDGPCDGGDLLNPDAGVTIFFATGGVIGENGIANFRAHYTEGDDLGEPDTQHVLGDGALDPSRAEVHMIIKYHGPPSDAAGVRARHPGPRAPPCRRIRPRHPPTARSVPTTTAPLAATPPATTPSRE